MPLSWGNENISVQKVLRSSCESFGDVGKYFCWFFMIQISESCSLHLSEKMIPTWFPAAVSFTAQSSSFIQRRACPQLLPTELDALCVDYWLPHNCFFGPKHVFRIRKMSPAPCPAVCPSAWPLCRLVCLLAVGQATPAYHQNQKGINGSYPSHRTQLRLGHTQDCCQGRCWLHFSYRFEPFLYERPGNARGYFLQVKKMAADVKTFTHHDVNWCFVFILVEQYIGTHENILL